MTKHLLLSTVSPIIALASLSAVHLLGQLPDTSTPLHLFVEKDIATDLKLSPTKSAKKVDLQAMLSDMDKTKVSGIIFMNMPDLNELISPNFIGEITTTKLADTIVYVGPKLGLTGDDDIGGGEFIVMAVGPQAESAIQAFTDIGESRNLHAATVKNFFIEMANSIDTDGSLDTSKHVGKSVSERLPEPA